MLAIKKSYNDEVQDYDTDENLVEHEEVSLKEQEINNNRLVRFAKQIILQKVEVFQDFEYIPV